MAFAFSFVWRYNVCVSHACLFRLVSVKMAFAFSFVWCHNAGVAHACLHLLRRLLRFLGIELQRMRFTRMHCVCIGLDDICVFLRMASKYMCFTRIFASVKTAFAFSVVLHHNTCVSNACLLRLRLLLRFSSYRVSMHAFHTHVCIG